MNRPAYLVISADALIIPTPSTITFRLLRTNPLSCYPNMRPRSSSSGFPTPDRAVQADFQRVHGIEAWDRIRSGVEHLGRRFNVLFTGPIGLRNENDEWHFDKVLGRGSYGMVTRWIKRSAKNDVIDVSAVSSGMRSIEVHWC